MLPLNFPLFFNVFFVPCSISLDVFGMDPIDLLTDLFELPLPLDRNTGPSFPGFACAGCFMGAWALDSLLVAETSQVFRLVFVFWVSPFDRSVNHVFSR